MKRFLKISPIVFLLFFTNYLQAQIVVNSTVTGTQLAQTLAGAGVNISNVVLHGSAGSAGIFTATGTNLGMSAGIILTSGDATGVVGPNNSPGLTGISTASTGDPDLDAIITPLTTNDACWLEFDAYVTSDTLVFNYVWGSEEYEEFVTGFNDVFALFISGPGIVGTQNIAIVPGTISTPVSIFNVNCNTNSAYYICNDAASSTYGGVCTAGCPLTNTGTTVQYDGFTQVFQAKQPVQRCHTYHLKMSVADAVDHALDSGIFLEANSLTSYGVKVTAKPTVSNYPNAVEGCINGSFCFERAKNFQDTLVIHFEISGSATNGVDYNQIPDSLVFYPNDTTLCIYINPVDEGVNEPVENVVIQIHYPSCGPNVLGDSIVLFIQDKLQITPNDTGICSQTAVSGVTLTTNVLGYVPPAQLTCGANGTSCGFAPVTQLIGNGTDNTTDPSFFNGLYQDNRMLIGYTAFDLISAGYTQGTIQSLAFNVLQVNSTIPYQNFSIKVGCANDAAATLPNVFPAALTPEFTSASYTPTLGWNTFPLSAPYDWDGINGIFVEICYDNTANSATDVLEKTITPALSVMYASDDGLSGCSLVYGTNLNFGQTSLRPNTKFSICAPAAAGYHFVWSPASAIVSGGSGGSPVVNVSATTTFTFTVDNIPGCPATGTQTLYLAPPYSLYVPDSVMPCKEVPFDISFTASTNDINFYKWNYNSSVGSLSCDDCANPSLKADEGGWLYLQTANVIGCHVNDSIWVHPDICPEIIVPSAFSPNGDGVNDYFFLLDRRFLKLNYFDIYNRWGELVYSTTDLSAKGWDGTFKSQKQNTGAYIYEISVLDKKNLIETKKGNITLFR